MAAKKRKRATRKSAAQKPDLSRRERQIMDILHRRDGATAHEVHEQMPEDTTYDSVRVTLRILEKKGHVKHTRDGQSYVYGPTVPRSKARRQAVGKLLDTFFPGEPGRAVLSLLDESAARLNSEDLEEIARWIEQAKQEES